MRNTEIPDERVKRTKKEENTYSPTSRFEKIGDAFATPQPRKIPVFDCDVALCTMRNELLVISDFA
jgi:hypothetical protein